MNKEDIEYIQWLGKRLVYRYQEDQDIINRVESIIKSWQKSFADYKYKEERIEKYTSDIVNSLLKLGTFNQEFRKNLEKEKKKESAQIVCSGVAFENLDFDDIFN
jgi:hypothetical protein